MFAKVATYRWDISFLVAASIVPGSDVTIERVGMNPLRTGIIDALKAMGAAPITAEVSARLEPRARSAAEHIFVMRTRRAF